MSTLLTWTCGMWKTYGITFVTPDDRDRDGLLELTQTNSMKRNLVAQLMTTMLMIFFRFLSHNIYSGYWVSGRCSSKEY